MVLATAALLLACGTDPPRCASVGCLTDRVAPALTCTEDSCVATYRGLLRALSPPEQLGVALELSRRFPDGEGERVCAWLSDPAGQESCFAWHHRPHLWTPLHPTPALRPRRPAPVAGEESMLCSSSQAPVACVLDAARGAAQGADVPAALALCGGALPDQALTQAGLTAAQLTAECHFLVADTSSGRSASRPPTAGA